jgi:hypothetical protein
MYLGRLVRLLVRFKNIIPTSTAEVVWAADIIVFLDIFFANAYLLLTSGAILVEVFGKSSDLH